MADDAGQGGEVVYCCDCANLFIPDKNSPSWRWLCQKHPRRKTGYVTRERYDKDAPYYYAVDINRDGMCPDFELKPKGEG